MQAQRNEFQILIDSVVVHVPIAHEGKCSSIHARSVALAGLLVLSSESHAADSFEAKSLATQRQRNVRVTSFSRDEVAAQHPRWAKGKFEAYLNHAGGWAESEQCVLECACPAAQRAPRRVNSVLS